MLYSFFFSISHTLLEWVLRRKVAEFERVNHYDMGYARAILEGNPQALLTLHRAAGLARYRGPLGATAHHAVRLAAAMHEDCGPCLQLGITMALRAGVSESAIAHVICGEPTGDAEADLVVALARAVLADAPDAVDLRERVVDRFGQDGLTAVAFALTGSRMYPMLKAVLGYAQCYPVVTVGKDAISLRPHVRPGVLPAVAPTALI